MFRNIITTTILSLTCTHFVSAEKKEVDEKGGVFVQLFHQFMQFREVEKDLEINLPQAEENKGFRGQLSKVIEIQADGTVSIDKKILTLDLLEKKLKLLVRVNKDQAVRIMGNRDVDYAKIVNVVDRCRKAGIWNISFSTSSPKKK